MSKAQQRHRKISQTLDPIPQETSVDQRAKLSLAAFMLSCILATSGCQVARQTASLPGQVVTAVVPGGKSAQPDAAALQSELLRYADDFSGRTTTGLDEYARRVNTQKAREEALHWKLALDTAVLGIAT